MTVDRRVQRTCEQLQNALRALLDEKTYDTITVQDITERANVGRSTFYLHFQSKDALFVHAHLAEIARITAQEDLFSVEALVQSEPSDALTKLYHYHWNHRETLRMVYFGQYGQTIFLYLRESNTQRLLSHLQSAFTSEITTIPLDVLAAYLIGSQMALMQTWIEKRLPYTPEAMAAYYQRLQSAVIRSALADGSNP